MSVRHVPDRDTAALIYDWNAKDRRGPVLRVVAVREVKPS